MARPPAWIKQGVHADYHAIIGGPVTRAGVTVQTEPFKMCDHWSVFVEGVVGSVSCRALTPVGEK